MTWKLLALCSAFFAGCTAVLIKLGVRDVPPTQATLLQVSVTLPFLAILAAVRGEWTPLSQVSGRSLGFLVFSGLCTGLSWLFYYRALKLGPASLVAPLDKLSMVAAVILAVTVLGERLSVQQWSGVTLMTAGALLLAWK